ncbi:MAG TPA: hypothetical protein VLF20_06385 [Patescibacteria group bacterium]|nr:hypothetical protein [Patescibacteria group bacterium]
MNIFFSKYKSLFLENKRVLIPLIPLVLFVLFFIVILFFSVLSPQSPQAGQNLPIPTTAAGDNQPTTQTSPFPQEQQEDGSSNVHGKISLYESDPLLQKKESLSDGLVRYAFQSSNSKRPNITIVKGEAEDLIFQRMVIEQTGDPVLLTEYLEFWGQPTNIFKGSHFYGNDAQTYFYANKGTAFIANPKTNRVLELHTFVLSGVQEYLQKYGEDIINK